MLAEKLVPAMTLANNVNMMSKMDFPINLGGFWNGVHDFAAEHPIHTGMLIVLSAELLFLAGLVRHKRKIGAL